MSLVWGDLWIAQSIRKPRQASSKHRFAHRDPEELMVCRRQDPIGLMQQITVFMMRLNQPECTISEANSS